MSMKVCFGEKVASQVRQFPCMRKDANNNILLFRDKSTCTIIYSPREENIGIQYTRGEYCFDKMDKVDGPVTLINVDQLEF